MILSFYSWENQVRIFGLIPNDIKSMWLVGEEEGVVHIGFIVSFIQSTAQYLSSTSSTALLTLKLTFHSTKND